MAGDGFTKNRPERRVEEFWGGGEEEVTTNITTGEFDNKYRYSLSHTHTHKRKSKVYIWDDFRSNIPRCC